MLPSGRHVAINLAPLDDFFVSITTPGNVERIPAIETVEGTCSRKGWTQWNLPLLIVPSGGYTDFSHRLIAEMLEHVLQPLARTGNT
jgi:hypothetical protein